jgi:hypothetical protein
MWVGMKNACFFAWLYPPSTAFGDEAMYGKTLCMHDASGYFVGRWVMGTILRLSIEHYSSKVDCLQAIHERRWTRRQLL